MRESPGDGMEDGTNEGLQSFFHSGINSEQLMYYSSCGIEPHSADYVRKG